MLFYMKTALTFQYLYILKFTKNNLNLKKIIFLLEKFLIYCFLNLECTKLSQKT